MNRQQIDDLAEEILAALQHQLSANKSRSTRKGIQKAKMSGKLVHRPPLGFKSVSRSIERSIIPDPDIAPFIKHAFSMYAFEGKSEMEISEYLFSQGIKNSSSGKPFSVSRVTRLLRNPTYAGIVWVDSDIGFVEGDFEPIVDKALFERVNMVYQNRKIIKL